MVLAVLAGIVLGLVSIIPFPFAARKGRTIDPSRSMNLLAPLLLTLLVSFVVLVAGMIVCKVVAPDVVIGFVVAEFATFVVAVIVFGIVLTKRR
ncbi:MAG: hypothetical protein Q4E12_06825 [Coriobacteriia bacterium]|nr:hypothetical protein [Coriobacteriia bacterium]